MFVFVFVWSDVWYGGGVRMRWQGGERVTRCDK